MRDITLIFGCMFSGKTTKLIEMYQFSQVESFEKLAIKPLIDTRYHPQKINSHGGLQLPGHRISKPEEIYPLVDAGIKEIYLDEVQFFHDSIVPVLLDISLQGIKVVAAGLDMDSKGEVFGPMNGLKKISQTHILLKAKCQTCGLPAMYTYRKASDENQLLIGSSNIYEARCEEHWKQ